MEELENVSKQERDTFRKHYEQLYRAFDELAEKKEPQVKTGSNSESGMSAVSHLSQ